VLNSGSALLGLSFGRPVLVPERGAMAELRELAGDSWVRTYSGDLSADVLRDAMVWAETASRDDLLPLDELAWHAIARQTLLAFEAVRLVPASVPQVCFSARATD
jgi:hypothetical protein